MTSALYQNSEAICRVCGSPLRRTSRVRFECLPCEAEYAVPPEVLMREAKVRPLL